MEKEYFEKDQLSHQQKLESCISSSHVAAEEAMDADVEMAKFNYYFSTTIQSKLRLSLVLYVIYFTFVIAC